MAAAELADAAKSAERREMEFQAVVFGSFYGQLESYSDSVALIEGDVEVSYASLIRSADEVTKRLGVERRLVFLETRNDSASIAAYLGCLRAGHPVYLFGAQDIERAEALADRYRPNLILRTGPAGLDAEWRHRDRLDLHADLRVLLSTSGSTGSPKFVKLSHRNVQSNAEAIAGYLELTGADRAATSLNFNYSYGMSVVNSHLQVGGSLLLTERSVSEPAFWDDFARHEATSFAGVPYTFELLRRGGEAWARSPSLRYATQAGGRLSPEHVRHFAGLSAANGWRFYVMYGQTEAAPRIAYLPPELAAAHPDCIGVAIPGGELRILDSSGASIDRPGIEGELAYRGPNVMMGYALATEALATDETPLQLLTGDIAKRNEAGLYQIVGRTSRIIKPFGVRINLDELQEQVRGLAPGAVCAGGDDRIVVACPPPITEAEAAQLPGRLADLYDLPMFLFHARVVDEIPLLGNGKTDVQAVLALAEVRRESAAAETGAGWFGRLGKRFGAGADATAALGVRGIFETFLAARPIDDGSTFEGLAGDSLSYVQAHMALEDYLQAVPEDWSQWTVADLERRRSDPLAVPSAASAASRGRLVILPSATDLLPAVKAFNGRLEAGGSPWRFYDTVKPDWLGGAGGGAATRVHFLAVDEEHRKVHGGFVLKQQIFLLDGEEVLIGNTQGPVSEGVVDPRFGSLGAILLREALALQPLQIGWGSTERKADLLASAGWVSHRIPILLHVVDAAAVLRRSAVLRRRAPLACIAEFAAATGLGALGVRVGQGLIGLSLQARPRWLVTEEAEFGAWADEVWEAARGAYGFAAVRDRAALQAVMPAGQWPDAILIKVETDDGLAGWAALRDRRLSGDPLFGDLRVGSVIDMLAKPGCERVVAAAAAQSLRGRGVELIGTVVSHNAWIAAFRREGFIVLPRRRNLSFSPELARTAGDFKTVARRAHLTLIDGDGPRIF